MADDSDYFEINEENLRDRSSQPQVRQIIDDLCNTSSKLQRKMNSGLSQNDFLRYKAYKLSVERAKVVLEQVWAGLQ